MILGRTPPLSDGERMEMFPILLNIMPWHWKAWNSGRSSHDEGSTGVGRAGWGGRGHRETDREGGLVRSRLNSTFPSSFSLLESCESELLLLSQSLLTNSKALVFPPQVFTSLANILEPEKLLVSDSWICTKWPWAVFWEMLDQIWLSHLDVTVQNPSEGHSHSWGTECDRWVREHETCLQVRHPPNIVLHSYLLESL